MDKFMEAMQQMAKMTDEERMQMIKAKKEVCICPTCPTYTDLAREKKELLYCALGKSPSITKELSCLCPDCPLTEQMGLKHDFFCTKGSEKEQRGM